jgi:uncharacterized ion transporter superfamily protein YfcC
VSESAGEVTGKKQLRFPHVYTLIFFLMIIIAVLTWIVPSGQFATQEVDTGSGTREVTVAGSYEEVSKDYYDEETGETVDLRQGVFDVLEAPTQGIQAAIDVVAFILIVGGSFGIITKTDAITAGMKQLIKKLKDKDILIIPIAMIMFSLGGTTFGMAEETLPFFIIFVPIMLSMGFDSMTAFLVCFVGPGVGYMASTINPFNVLIAEGILGIQGNPQLMFRFIYWVILTAIAIAWVTHYAMKVRKDPTSSICYEADLQKRNELSVNTSTEEGSEFTSRQKGVVIVFVAGLLLIVWGLVTQGWYMDELSGIFLAMGILSGIIAGMNEQEIASEFVHGLQDFAYAAIVVGLARAILVLAQNGMIIDTILNALSSMLNGVPVWLYIVLVFVVLGLVAFLVPSSSGLAALTMPIIGPLTELMGLNAEGAVTALCFASKIVSMINPLSAITVAGLGLCGLTLNQWFKVGWKFLLFCSVFGIACAAISALM